MLGMYYDCLLLILSCLSRILQLQSGPGVSESEKIGRRGETTAIRGDWLLQTDAAVDDAN